MATATRTKKRAKRTAKKKANGADLSFRGKAAEKNEATSMPISRAAGCTNCGLPLSVFVIRLVSQALIVTNEIYTRDMLMEWSKAQLTSLLQQSGIDPGLVRDRTVETLANKAIENQEKLIVPDALKA